MPSGSLDCPVLDGEAGDAAELALVVGDEGEAERTGVGSDEEVEGADAAAGCVRLGADGAVGLSGAVALGGDLEGSREARQARLCTTIRPMPLRSERPKGVEE